MISLKYRSGEEIKRGDRVLLHGEQGEIELIATDPDNPETSWHMEQFGGGILISEPKVFGHLFIRASELEKYEDLEFVSRA
jgi:hypothetical protein